MWKLCTHFAATTIFPSKYLTTVKHYLEDAKILLKKQIKQQKWDYIPPFPPLYIARHAKFTSFFHPQTRDVLFPQKYIMYSYLLSLTTNKSVQFIPFHANAITKWVVTIARHQPVWTIRSSPFWYNSRVIFPEGNQKGWNSSKHYPLQPITFS